MKTIIYVSGTDKVQDRRRLFGLTEYATRHGWNLQTVEAMQSPQQVKELMRIWKPDGIIIDASGNPRMFDNAKFGKIPVVLMNPETSIRGHQHPSVSSDSEEIARLAVSELLELNPSSLVFIEWFDPSIVWSAVKRTAMEKITRMHGLPLTIITPTHKDADNPARLEKLIESAIAHLPRPCGIFAVTDMIGAAAVSAAARLDVRIPDDIAVISVDDDPEICENCVPSLSSVRPDFLQLGTSAARLLDDAMSGRCGHDVKVIVPPLRIVRRASTRSTQTYDRNVREALETIRLGACTGITPAKIAESFGISRRMVELRFKAATGKTMGDAILDQRLSVACDFLKDGKTAISAIANFCGWKSDIAFRKVFISRFGVSPREWQRTHRQTGSAMHQG